MTARRVDEFEVARLLKSTLTDKCLSDEDLQHLSPWQRQNLRKQMRKALAPFGLKLVHFWTGFWLLVTDKPTQG